jgi:uncharacterized YccA/Bax inhibitor family protein
MTRILAGIGALLLMSYATVSTVNLNLAEEFALWAIVVSPAIVGAIFCLWIALRWDNSDSRRLMRSTFRGGVLAGVVGLIAGMVLPIVFKPEANQGPMLGIFITGPVGFFAGMLVSYVIARRKMTDSIENSRS